MSEGISECPKCHALLGDGVTVCEQCGVAAEIALSSGPTSPLISNSPVHATKAELLSSVSAREPSRVADLIMAVLVAVVICVVMGVLYKVSVTLFYVVLVFFGPSAIAAYYVGRRTGNGVVAMIWGALLGPAGIVVAFVLPDKNREECPFCAEQIMKSATICPHCRSDV